MFDRYEGGEQAVLVHVDFSAESDREDLDELKMLVDSAGVTTLAVLTTRRSAPHPKFYIGTGKAEEVAEAVRMLGAEVVIFNHALSPAQERNLEQLFQCRVLDRTTLILDIFAQRARTHEGKLQVELAQLKHLSTRLVRGWTHLERQKGGIGLRGPGETQLETDRRLLRDRINHIEKRLEKVAKQREQGRRARSRREVPTISLVGYTNAGKSTLFNALTSAEVYAADQLFATLDPTLRKIQLADVGPAILADTVGFIRHLPHDLVAAFKATLEETREASLLLHVVDAADERASDNIQQVNEVLAEIDAGDVPVLMVYNKLDKLDDVAPRIDRSDDGTPVAVWVSAQQGLGLELLFKALSERMADETFIGTLNLPPVEGKLRAELFSMQAVVKEEIDEMGHWQLWVRMPQMDWHRLDKQNQGSLQRFIVSDATDKVH
ncbi:ribosome rescue GTPase HflX [Gallaecimonas mangrovi]|uniref:ribosome rescue GTPase HflX n=1 Tax=Gallaecimonas mangrovi TaxID=2291597 RepID=UPI000E2016C4|nr:ribosome rescue GTPase HflX [Gallaecimonas mangrovi]